LKLAEKPNDMCIYKEIGGACMCEICANTKALIFLDPLTN